jgi:arabinan endo-1,5-alpha-L-arabinosidase
VPLSDDGDQFRAVLTNGAGSDTTDPATLTVYRPTAPTVTNQPTSLSVPVNASVSFTAAASGAPPPTVQWELSTDGGTWDDLGGELAGVRQTT